jgi:DHA3 family multidrug efflux protein-like MFS transporter
VWFAVTFWAYLETKSVIVTSIMAGIFTVTVALSGFVLGSVVDHNKKKRAMLLSSSATLVFFVAALLIYLSFPSERFTHQANFELWLFIIASLAGALVGNLRGIALSTLVTVLIPEEERDRANGMIGTANGVAFLVGSILSGLAVGFLGIVGMLVGAIVLTALVIVHLATLQIPEPERVHAEGEKASIDIRGSIAAIQLVPGLFGLIFFHTFNNFLGGVFMSLMDPYGLELVSVQTWGILWGILSLGFIVGGIIVAQRGLGKNPLRTLFLCNIVTWSICCVFTLNPSIVLLAVGMFLFLTLMPVIEAAEQTILQKVVPPERQGRVFGLAQSIEQSASPITAFLIGPIAQLIFIPFMTTGAGVELIGGWFGTGTDRGLALLFTATGLIGLVITLISMQSNAYKKLSTNYMNHPGHGTSTPNVAEPRFPDGVAVALEKTAG